MLIVSLDYPSLLLFLPSVRWCNSFEIQLGLFVLVCFRLQNLPTFLSCLVIFYFWSMWNINIVPKAKSILKHNPKKGVAPLPAFPTLFSQLHVSDVSLPLEFALQRWAEMCSLLFPFLLKQKIASFTCSICYFLIF